MIDRAAAAVVEAVARMRPARLRVGQGRHWFGMDDGTDPQVIDPRMNVLQATGADGRVIGTVVQWNNHPETTLGWEPPVDIAASARSSAGRATSAPPRAATSPPTTRACWPARSPGGSGRDAATSSARSATSSAPGGAVWEVDRPPTRSATSFDPPPGAAPGGATFTYTDDNFRRAVVIGEQAAIAGAEDRGHGKWVTDPAELEAPAVLLRALSNIGFRVLLVRRPGRPGTRRSATPPVAYTCPATGPKTDAHLHERGDRDRGTIRSPATIRKGDHLKTAVSYLEIGSEIGMMFLPGESAGELAVGLPAASARTARPLVRRDRSTSTPSAPSSRRPATCSAACPTATGSRSASATTSSATSSRSATGGSCASPTRSPGGHCRRCSTRR